MKCGHALGGGTTMKCGARRSDSSAPAAATRRHLVLRQLVAVVQPRSIRP